jgi:hypothetical protein
VLGKPEYRRYTMLDVTRRGFVRSSAGAAAGATALGALLAQRADADAAVGSEPIVAYISDPRTGDITVMGAAGEVTIHDRRLTAQIVRHLEG